MTGLPLPDLRRPSHPARGSRASHAWRTVLLVAVVAISLSACGGDDSSDVEAASVPTVSEAPAIEGAAGGGVEEIEYIAVADERFVVDCGGVSPAASFSARPLPGGGPTEIEPPVLAGIAAAGPEAAGAVVADGELPGRFGPVDESEVQKRTAIVLANDATTLRLSRFELVEGGWTIASSEYCDA